MSGGSGGACACGRAAELEFREKKKEERRSLQLRLHTLKSVFASEPDSFQILIITTDLRVQTQPADLQMCPLRNY